MKTFLNIGLAICFAAIANLVVGLGSAKAEASECFFKTIQIKASAQVTKRFREGEYTPEKKNELARQAENEALRRAMENVGYIEVDPLPPTSYITIRDGGGGRIFATAHGFAFVWLLECVSRSLNN